MRKKYLKGSYTVEAAVIFSVLFFILASLILCMFYLHDRAVAQSAACEAAAVGSNFIKTQERQEAVASVKKQAGSKRFLGSRDIGTNVAVGEKEVDAVWRGTYPVPGFAAKYLSGGKLTIDQSWSSRIIDSADAIRKIKGIGDFISGGSD